MRKQKIYPEIFLEKINFFSGVYARGSLHHAYLFFGDPHVGKKTFARLFASFLERSEFSEEKRLLSDFFELVPNEEGHIGIDEVRSARRFLSQTPTQSSRRVVLISASHMLTDEAQGAFLKIVEEPPHSACIIFVAESSEVLLPPLASRLVKIYFPRLSCQELTDLLMTHEAISFDAAKKIAERAYGRIGRARELLKEKRKEPTELSEKITQKILFLREKDAQKYSGILARLLHLEEQVARYNVNKRLQEKALEYLLHS